MRKLTTREIQLILLACEGKTDKEIATTLSISAGTVITIWATIRRRLGSNSRTSVVAAVAWAIGSMGTRRVPDMADTEASPFVILGKQRVVVLCNYIAGKVFQTRPGLTFDQATQIVECSNSKHGSPPVECLEVVDGRGQEIKFLVERDAFEDDNLGPLQLMRFSIKK